MINFCALAALFAAFISITATAQAHGLGDGGAHSHLAENQGLAALFADPAWLVLAAAAALTVTGFALGRWKRSQA